VEKRGESRVFYFRAAEECVVCYNEEKLHIFSLKIFPIKMQNTIEIFRIMFYNRVKVKWFG